MREYQMEEMKRIIGHNIVALRRGAGLKQSELAERLNYSDKAVSKWECGDAVPDILTLTRISEMFGVTLDWLVKGAHEVDMSTAVRVKERRHTIITLLSAVLVWLVAAAGFALLGGVLGSIASVWLVFIYAIPTSSIVVLVLASVWKRKALKYTSLTILLWGSILSIYLTFLICFPQVFSNSWLLFIPGVPFQIFIFLWPHLSPSLRKKKRPYITE